MQIYHFLLQGIGIFSTGMMNFGLDSSYSPASRYVLSHSIMASEEC